MREERLRSARFRHQLESCKMPWTGAVNRKSCPGIKWVYINPENRPRPGPFGFSLGIPEECAHQSPGTRLPALLHRHRSRPWVAKGRGPQPPENPPLKCNVIDLSLPEGCGSEHPEAGRQRLPALLHLAIKWPPGTKGQRRPTGLKTLPKLPSIVAGGSPKRTSGPVSDVGGEAPQRSIPTPAGKLQTALDRCCDKKELSR
uniref:Uncharacterized protein n=1 Tax=Sphaerodactylus townsendi TaxID=933632 RepID=A0ACB8FX68_9SAUR